MTMKATIYDVAREAGVSIATVSKVLNGKGKISLNRQREIFQVMERLNYRPSVIAAALTNKKTYTLGLLIPDISNPFFAEIARAVEDQGHYHGYSVVICSTDNQDERIERYISLLHQKSVDGLIIGTGVSDSGIMARLMEKSIPVALIAREMPSMAVSTVVVDDFAGGRMAGFHLTRLGHSRFAVLSESRKVVSSSTRVLGFREAVEEAGFKLPGRAIKRCETNIDDAKSKAAELLNGKQRPTALFCCNDMLAVGALQAAAQLRIRVPEELSVISFDDTILASVLSPRLTTVSQPIEQMGKLAVDLIVRQLRKESNVKQRIVLHPQMVYRDSTAAPKPL